MELICYEQGIPIFNIDT